MIADTTREHLNFGGAGRARPRATGVGILFIILLGFGMRLTALGLMETWYDEAIAYLVGIGGGPYFDPSLQNDKPPLFYHAIHLWTRLHESLYFARLLEALCGTATIGALYLLVRNVAGTRAALFAAFVQAASPFALLYSREAGPHALAQLLAVLAILGLERYLATGVTRVALLALAAQTAAIFTTYSALPLAPAMLVALYARRSNRQGIWGEWLALQALFLVPAAFWFYSALESQLLPAVDFVSGWIPELKPAGYLPFLNTLVFGYFTNNIPVWFLAAPLLVLAVAGLADAGGRWIAIFFFLPLVILAALSGVKNVMLPRYFILYAPALIALAGVGFAILNFTLFRVLAALWVAAGLAGGAAGYYGNEHRDDDVTANRRKAFTRAADFLDRRLSAGAPLYHSSQNSTAVMALLRPGRWRHEWLAAGPGVAAMSPGAIQTSQQHNVAFITPHSWGEGPQFPAWVLYSSWAAPIYRDMPVAAFRRRIEALAAPDSVARFEGIDVVHYIPYETDLLDRTEEESGGARLYVDRTTGEEFPKNHRALRPGFSGTILNLTPERAVELHTGYPSAQITLTAVSGYPVEPVLDGEGGFRPSPDGYRNSLCYQVTVNPRQTVVLPLTTAAPPGEYHLFARVRGGKGMALLRAYAGDDPLKGPGQQGEAAKWEWVRLGTFLYDGNVPLTIHASPVGGAQGNAALHSLFLIPVEGGVLTRKTFLLEQGRLFREEGLPAQLPVTVFASDDVRGELLTVFAGR